MPNTDIGWLTAIYDSTSWRSDVYLQPLRGYTCMHMRTGAHHTHTHTHACMHAHMHIIINNQDKSFKNGTDWLPD